jgi:diacylglycerol kinase family enzyme
MYFYIVNPSSGNARINKIQTRLLSLLRENRVYGDFVKTTGKGDAARLVHIAIEKGATNIVAVGGDSTVSEVINEIHKTDAILGIIPIGRTNVLARSLGITNWQESVKILSRRRVKTLSLGEVEGKLFVTSIEVGFESEIQKDREDNSFLKNIILKKKVAQKLLSFKPFLAEVRFDQEFLVKSSMLNISVVNPSFSQEKDKGKLVTYIVPNQPKMSLLAKSLDISNLNYDKIPFISQFKAKRIKIETPEKNQPVYADSALIGKTPVIISLSDKKIRAIVSKGF